MRQLVVVGLVAQAACVRPDVLECGDGVICPTGMECWAERNVCVDPQGLSVPDTTFDIGRVVCGTTAWLDVELQNFSATDVELTASTTLAGIRVSPDQGVVPAGGTLTLRLEALPVAQAIPGVSIEGSLVIDTFVGQITRPLTLTHAGGVAKVQPSLDFGESEVSTTTTRELEITNEGDEAFDVVVNLAGSSFEVTSARERRIAPRTTDTVELAFTPPTIRPWAGTLALTYLQPLCQPATSTVALGGIASGAPLLVDHTELAFDKAGCGASQDKRTITLTSKLDDPQVLTYEITGPDASAFSVTGDSLLASTGPASVTVTRLATPPNDSTGPRSALLEITASPSGETKQIKLSFDLKAPSLKTSEKQFVIEVARDDETKTGEFVVENEGNDLAHVSISPPVLAGNGFTLSVQPTSFTLPPEGHQPMTWKLTRVADPDGTLMGDVIVDAAGACSSPLKHAFIVKVK